MNAKRSSPNWQCKLGQCLCIKGDTSVLWGFLFRDVWEVFTIVVVPGAG